MRNRYRGRHRKEPYGATIGQKTVHDLIIDHDVDEFVSLFRELARRELREEAA